MRVNDARGIFCVEMKIMCESEGERVRIFMLHAVSNSPLALILCFALSHFLSFCAVGKLKEIISKYIVNSFIFVSSENFKI